MNGWEGNEREKSGERKEKEIREERKEQKGRRQKKYEAVGEKKGREADEEKWTKGQKKKKSLEKQEQTVLVWPRIWVYLGFWVVELCKGKGAAACACLAALVLLSWLPREMRLPVDPWGRRAWSCCFWLVHASGVIIGVVSYCDVRGYGAGALGALSF